ncbi:MAG: IS66 family insertion sequence element accessory protein TnpB [Labilithrix sp.]|nr:IS66 family insertion sequence element accessory protein TnpB [Labilithrix sp.]
MPKSTLALRRGAARALRVFGRRRDALKRFPCSSTAAGWSSSHKRLDRGVFQIPEPPTKTARHVEIDEATLEALLDGVDVTEPAKTPPRERTELFAGCRSKRRPTRRSLDRTCPCATTRSARGCSTARPGASRQGGGTRRLRSRRRSRSCRPSPPSGTSSVARTRWSGARVAAAPLFVAKAERIDTTQLGSEVRRNESEAGPTRTRSRRRSRRRSRKLPPIKTR